VASDPIDPRGSREVWADICVIGAGPAGLAFASAWAGSERRLVILESGGHGLDEDAQSLSEGAIDSDYHLAHAVRDGRRRQVGGTANVWLYETRPDDGLRYARALLPEPIDLQPSRAGSTAWPMTSAELAPFHERATTLWLGAPASADLTDWTSPTVGPVQEPQGTLQTRIVLHGPADAFKRRLRSEVMDAPNIQLLIGHTVLALESEDGGRSIARAQVATADGTRTTVRAGTFVLAAGGIENAQILLSSEPTAPGGPANPHDVVGRYITDHPEFRAGMVELQPGAIESLTLYDIRRRDGVMAGAVLSLSEAVKRDAGLLNVGASLVPQVDGFGTSTHRQAGRPRSTHRQGPPHATHRPVHALDPVQSVSRVPWRLVAARRRPRADPSPGVPRRDGAVAGTGQPDLPRLGP
jgi:choline dehydrogenase-like flavoprotein